LGRARAGGRGAASFEGASGLVKARTRAAAGALLNPSNPRNTPPPTPRPPHCGRHLLQRVRHKPWVALRVCARAEPEVQGGCVWGGGWGLLVGRGGSCCGSAGASWPGSTGQWASTLSLRPALCPPTTLPKASTSSRRPASSRWGRRTAAQTPSPPLLLTLCARVPGLPRVLPAVHLVPCLALLTLPLDPQSRAARRTAPGDASPAAPRWRAPPPRRRPCRRRPLAQQAPGPQTKSRPSRFQARESPRRRRGPTPGAAPAPPAAAPLPRRAPFFTARFVGCRGLAHGRRRPPAPQQVVAPLPARSARGGPSGRRPPLPLPLNRPTPARPGLPPGFKRPAARPAPWSPRPRLLRPGCTTNRARVPQTPSQGRHRVLYQPPRLRPRAARRRRAAPPSLPLNQHPGLSRAAPRARPCP
jgi:hypothetical protein